MVLRDIVKSKKIILKLKIVEKLYRAAKKHGLKDIEHMLEPILWRCTGNALLKMKELETKMK